MDYYLILARSVTYAQRMRLVLEKQQITCQIFRAPRDLTDLGCGYAVKIAAQDLSAALILLHREKLDPVQIFLFHNGYYQEVTR